MTLPRVLVLVLAGGAGSRLELLTERRAKAAVPFAGVYRLVDFPLSNCQHSQLAGVWVTTQFHPASLAQHLANGRRWDLDCTSTHRDHNRCRSRGGRQHRPRRPGQGALPLLATPLREHAGAQWHSPATAAEAAA